MGDLELVVDGLTVRFGGAVAVDDLSLRARTGRITALIGPNGAGKTTTFNACAGLLRPSAGQVTLAGRDVTNASPQTHARLGLGRTFQRMELWESLTVEANVALGREALLAGNRPARHLLCGRRERAEVAEAARSAMSLCGIESLRARPAGSLSTGQRRLVELARATAGGFQLLLLDEPSSGLDHAETDRFGEILQGLVAQREMGILLVEHDMRLVMAITEHLYVLDFGRLIFEGDAGQARASHIVREAYLGAA